MSLAEPLQATVGAWCAERKLGPGAQAKIAKELQSRLDAALAQACHDADAPSFPGADAC